VSFKRVGCLGRRVVWLADWMAESMQLYAQAACPLLCGSHSFRLKSKLAQLLQLLRMYHHKVQVLEAAAKASNSTAVGAAAAAGAAGAAPGAGVAVPDGGSGRDEAAAAGACAAPAADQAEAAAAEQTSQPPAAAVPPPLPAAAAAASLSAPAAELLAAGSLLLTAAGAGAAASQPTSGALIPAVGGPAPWQAPLAGKLLQFDPSIGRHGAFIVIDVSSPADGSPSAAAPQLQRRSSDRLPRGFEPSFLLGPSDFAVAAAASAAATAAGAASSPGEHQALHSAQMAAAAAAEDDAKSMISQLTVSDAPPPRLSTGGHSLSAAAHSGAPHNAQGPLHSSSALGPMRNHVVGGSTCAGGTAAANGAWGSPTRRQLLSLADSLDALAHGGQQGSTHSMARRPPLGQHRLAAAAQQPQLGNSYSGLEDGCSSMCEVPLQGVGSSDLRVMVQREAEAGGGSSLHHHPVEQWRFEAAAVATTYSPSPLPPAPLPPSRQQLLAVQHHHQEQQQQQFMQQQYTQETDSRAPWEAAAEPGWPPAASLAAAAASGFCAVAGAHHQSPVAPWEEPYPDAHCSEPALSASAAQSQLHMHEQLNQRHQHQRGGMLPRAAGSSSNRGGGVAAPSRRQRWSQSGPHHPHPHPLQQQAHGGGASALPLDRLVLSDTAALIAASGSGLPPLEPAEEEMARRFDESLIDLLMEVEELEQRRDHGVAWGGGGAHGGVESAWSGASAVHAQAANDWPPWQGAASSGHAWDGGMEAQQPSQQHSGGARSGDARTGFLSGGALRSQQHHFGGGGAARMLSATPAPDDDDDIVSSILNSP